MRFTSSKFLSLLIALPSAFAAINGKCSSGNGVCVTTTSCTSSGGTYVSGKCPNDPSNVKCCNKACSVNGKSGQCMFKSQCTGTTYSGYCPGGSDFVCCIPSAPKVDYGTCTVSGTKGKCMKTTQCKGTYYSGYCPGDSSIQCCLDSPIDTGNTGNKYGNMSTKFIGTVLSKDQFISKVSSYCRNHPGTIAQAMCNNPGLVYDTSKSNNVNALLVIVRAIVEGNSPGAYKNNYWGIGCVNGGGAAACYSYTSLAEGIKGFANTVTGYANLTAMMSKYAYIGKYWYNPGSWSNGGCIYFPYIKQYMSSTRSNTVTAICGKKTQCTTSGGDCTATTQEDQNAYATWQVVDKMGPTFKNVFGI